MMTRLNIIFDIYYTLPQTAVFWLHNKKAQLLLNYCA